MRTRSDRMRDMILTGLVWAFVWAFVGGLGGAWVGAEVGKTWMIVIVGLVLGFAMFGACMKNIKAALFGIWIGLWVGGIDLGVSRRDSENMDDYSEQCTHWRHFWCILDRSLETGLVWGLGCVVGLGFDLVTYLGYRECVIWYDHWWRNRDGSWGNIRSDPGMGAGISATFWVGTSCGSSTRRRGVMKLMKSPDMLSWLHRNMVVGVIATPHEGTTLDVAKPALICFLPKHSKFVRTNIAIEGPMG